MTGKRKGSRQQRPEVEILTSDEDSHSGTDSLSDSSFPVKVIKDPTDLAQICLEWERLYRDLDRANARGEFKAADKLCGSLLDSGRWPDRLLRRPWSYLRDGSVRPWAGCLSVYPKEYRVIDGIREAWVCLLMNFCQWDRAVHIADQCIEDPKCILISAKAQVAIYKIHSLLESRRIRDAIQFRDMLFDGSTQMTAILKCIEESFTFGWHYALARINFIHHDMEKAMHHAEAACTMVETIPAHAEEPFQSRLWVFVIRAYTRGIACLGNKDYSGMMDVLQLWDRTVCDLDRKATQNTSGLKENSIFGRLMFVEFLAAILRGCSELDIIRNYAEDYLNNQENKYKVELNRDLTVRIRAVTSELLKTGLVSLEVCSSRYNQTLDRAVTECNFLSTILQGIVENWTLIIDAGEVGNQGRFANHCDDPNAVLALGTFSGVRVRTIRSIKTIRRGEEITVHYGVNYWDAIQESRNSELSKRYNGGSDHEKSKKKNSCSIYQLKTKSTFHFFDGIINDVHCSGLPANVLLQSMGCVDEAAIDMEASCLEKGLLIMDCPQDHPAFPGKMLVADRDFNVGEEICIYAGVLIKAPARRLDLRESDYIVSICNATCGPYGFELEDVRARNGCVFKKIQPGLPAPPLDTRYADPPTDLSGIEDIKGLGKECTQLIIMALQNEEYHGMLRQLIRKLYRLPDKNWKSLAITEIKKSFSIFRKRQLPPIPVKTDDMETVSTTSVENGENICPPPTNFSSTIDIQDKQWMPSDLRSHLKMRSSEETTSKMKEEQKWSHLEQLLMG
jgi:hypothetical protein